MSQLFNPAPPPPVATTGQAQPGGPMNANPDQIAALQQQIAQMPPGPQKQAMLARLARDYQGESDLANRQLDTAEVDARMPSPEGQSLGGRYSTHVAASPLEHVTSAIQRGRGMKKEKEMVKNLQGLSQDKQQAIADFLRSGLGNTP